MPTNNQRREASRRQLEAQLKLRQQQAAARKRFTLIASIIGSIVAIVVIIVVIAVVAGNSGNSKKKTPVAAASSTPAATTASTPAAASSSARAATGKSVTFDGVTVKGAADLGGAPAVSSKPGAAPTAVEYKDLVVGKGKAAVQGQSVTVQYVGALYKNGTVFDSSWKNGAPATFTLATGANGVITGFDYGIGGHASIPPMKIGGRRIIIIPSALGYGATASGSIPANSTLVFVVDLKSTAS